MSNLVGGHYQTYSTTANKTFDDIDVKLMGAYRTCSAFEQHFNVKRGDVSPDGEVTIEFVECLASCGTAPVVMIDDALHEKVDASKALDLSVKIKAEAANRR